MHRVLDEVIYYMTAPIRLFGRARWFRLAVAGCIVLVLSFAAANWALNYFLPENDAKKAVANLPALPPLPPVTRASYVIAPVTVPLALIQQNLDKAAPREFSGKGSEAGLGNLLSNVDIGVVVTRGTMSVTGRPNVLTVTTPLTSSVHITGQFVARTANQASGLASGLAGSLGDKIGGDIGKLLNNDLGKQIGGAVGEIAKQTLNQTSNVRGQVIVQSQPALAANWRLQPNLAANIALDNNATQIGGARLNLGNQVMPLIDQEVKKQVAALETRLRNDPTLEKSVREQWGQMCRSIPLGGGDTGLPKLWLEMKPVRAQAAQPRIDARNLTLTIGVQAETRIVPTETKPACPFPAQIELVPPMDNGKLAVGLPIDVPFTEVNKLLEAQLKGRHFPEDGNAPVDVEIKRMSLAAAGDRMLISLNVNAREKKSWFGFGAGANVLIWGKPVLDQKTQVLRLTEPTLAVESEAVFGLLSAAARAAMPYLQQALADNAVVDLKPFAADAKKKIAEALAEFEKTGASGVKVEAAVNDLRLTGIAFDANTLRVIAEADGTAKVAVNKLPGM